MTIKDGIKYVVIFASGAVSGILVSKGYFEKRTNEEIASVKESLSTMIHLKRPEKKEEKESNDIPAKKDPRKAEVVVDYSGYTKVVKEYSAEDDDPAESESPSDEDEDDDVKNYLDGKRDSEAPRREPRLIKYEDFGELPYYDKITLLYYIEDGVVTTEDDELITNPEEILGNCLVKFGFDKNDERVIFVRNERNSTDYEIDKVFDSYERSTLNV